MRVRAMTEKPRDRLRLTHCEKCGDETAQYMGLFSIDTYPPKVSARYDCLSCGHRFWKRDADDKQSTYQLTEE